MKAVGIYLRTFPRISETFVSEQANRLTHFQPKFVANTLLQETSLPCVALSQSDRFKLKQTSYLLTRAPNLYGACWSELTDLSLIHAHFGPNGVYALPLARKLKVPLVVTFHGYDITLNRRAVWRTGKLLYYQLLWHERELQSQAAGFIAVSQFIRDRLIEHGYPKEKILLHYIGVDTEKFVPGNNQAEERYILCVGRHTEKKGIDTLMRGFARIAKRHPEVKLLQVGRGELTAKLQTLARQLGIEGRMHFLGAQPHAKVLELMQQAEIFALPSQVAKSGECEGLPIVILEASACGVPVVATYHSGIPEAVMDGETGFLVAEKDDRALAEKLDLLLGDRALGRRLGSRGRELIEAKFDIRQQTAKLEDIYRSLI